MRYPRLVTPGQPAPPTNPAPRRNRTRRLSRAPPEVPRGNRQADQATLRSRTRRLQTRNEPHPLVPSLCRNPIGQSPTPMSLWRTSPCGFGVPSTPDSLISSMLFAKMEYARARQSYLSCSCGNCPESRPASCGSASPTFASTLHANDRCEPLIAFSGYALVPMTGTQFRLVQAIGEGSGAHLPVPAGFRSTPLGQGWPRTTSRSPSAVASR